MLKPEEPRFSDDEEQRPLMAEKELRDACLYAAAIIVVAFSLGCEFEDCMLDDDGYPWPTATTRIEIKYPEDWRWQWGIFPIVGAIHEAGAAAVCKAARHRALPHQCVYGAQNVRPSRRPYDLGDDQGARPVHSGQRV